MIRNKALTSVLALLTLGLMTHQVPALDIVWDGGEGFWDGLHWNDSYAPDELGARRNGSDGYASPNETETFIISGEDSRVIFDANNLGSDFYMKQGSSLIIQDGATWIQPTEPTWSENRWTEFDADNLIIDGGTFDRTGAVPGEGGGALIFGSWRGDDNFSNPLSPMMHQVTNIEILNGGRLINEGQLWFGGWEDTAPNGTVINMTINDGTVDLTGGDVIGVGDVADADLVFTNRFPPDEPENQPTYSINFTGPGSITVDRSGIINTFMDEFEIWQNLEPITYEALWDAGILQANGQSGVDGADFSQFFTTSGSLGMDDYTLMSMVTGVVGIPGDYSGNGLVEQADLDLVLGNWGVEATNVPAEWMNDPPTGFVDQEELDKVLGSWGSTAPGLAAAGAVPEPATWALLLVAGLAAVGLGRR